MGTLQQEFESDVDRVRVVLLTSSLERGGAERQVVELANALDSSTFDVQVCSLSPINPLAAELRDADQRLTVIPKRRRFDAALLFRLARFLSRQNVHILHSFLFDAEIAGRLAGTLARVPAIVCSNRCPHHGRAAFKRWIARLTAPFFDILIANSWAGLEYERDIQGIDPARLCAIPNGINAARFTPGANAAARRELGIDKDAVVLGMFAHFRGNKDHETLIAAAEKLLPKYPGTLLVFAGAPDGSQSNSIFTRCRVAVERAGLANRIRFLGPRCDMAELYRMLDIKVLSTRFEGTPNVVLEAMASGLPVVATDVSDNKRIILDGKTGFIVPPRDADLLAKRLAALIENKPLRDAMGAAGRRRAEQEYSTDVLAQRTESVYLSILRQKGAMEATRYWRPTGSDA